MTCPISNCRVTASEGLCKGHTNQLRQWLLEINIFYTTTDATPVRTGDGGGKGTEPTIGVNVPSLSWLNGNDIYLILRDGWERLIRQERNLTPAGLLPSLPGVGYEVSRIVKFHDKHLDWSVQQPWADTFYAEVRELHRVGMVAAREWAEKQTRIKCPAEIEPGVTCNAFVTLNVASPLDAFRCRLCATEWTTLRLVAVAKENRSKALWVDIDTAAALLNRSASQVRRVARKIHGNRQRRDLVNLHLLLDFYAA